MVADSPHGSRQFPVSAVDLRGYIAAGELSASEVAREFTARIQALDRIGAFVYVDEDGAIEQARVLDGRTRRREGGLLHGIPIAVKDSIDVAGMPTTAGSRAMHRVPRQDSEAVAALRRHGAVIVGKLAMSELSAGDSLAPVANPWSHIHSAGGSSSGAAAAVAAQLVPLALGCDTGGSIRIPSSFCGVVGFRPTARAVSMAGIVPLSPTLDEVGPIARSAADARLLFTALAGPPVGEDGARAPRPERLRIARLDGIFREGVTPHVGQAVDAVENVLLRRHGPLTAASVPEARFADVSAWVISYAEALRVHGHLLKVSGSSLTQRLFIKLTAATFLTERDVALAFRLKSEIASGVRSALASADVLLTPTTLMTAPIREAAYDAGALTRPFSLAGLPALSVPFLQMGELPVGVQLIGPSGSERLLFGLAAEIEAALDPVAAPLEHNRAPQDEPSWWSDERDAIAKATDEARNLYDEIRAQLTDSEEWLGGHTGVTDA